MLIGAAASGQLGFSSGNPESITIATIGRTLQAAVRAFILASVTGFNSYQLPSYQSVFLRTFVP